MSFSKVQIIYLVSLHELWLLTSFSGGMWLDVVGFGWMWLDVVGCGGMWLASNPGGVASKTQNIINFGKHKI